MINPAQSAYIPSLWSGSGNTMRRAASYRRRPACQTTDPSQSGSERKCTTSPISLATDTIQYVVRDARVRHPLAGWQQQLVSSWCLSHTEAVGAQG